MSQQSEVSSFKKFEQYLAKQKEFFPHREGTWLFSQLLQSAKERDQQLRELERVARNAVEAYSQPHSEYRQGDELTALRRKLDELGGKGEGE